MYYKKVIFFNLCFFLMNKNEQINSTNSNNFLLDFSNTNANESNIILNNNNENEDSNRIFDKENNDYINNGGKFNFLF